MPAITEAYRQWPALQRGAVFRAVRKGNRLSQPLHPNEVPVRFKVRYTRRQATKRSGAARLAEAQHRV